MINKKEKIILIDCDGVLLDWKFAFQTWMETMHGLVPSDSDQYEIAGAYDMSFSRMEDYIIEFNNSASIGFLPPLRDAVYYIKQLHKMHGFQFHMITSLSKQRHPQQLREQNVEYLFGKNMVTHYKYLDTGAPKDEILKDYQGSECFWIEDKIENAQQGEVFGLNPILIAHDYNNNDTDIPRFWKWKDVYQHILETLGHDT